MTQQELVDIQLTIAAPVETVFRALTDADELRQWFTEHAEVSLPKKRYRFWGRYIPEAPSDTADLQTLLAVETNHHLSYQWGLHNRETIVTIRLEKAQSGTKLRLQHQNVRPPQPYNYTMGDFWSLTLENLRSWVERGSIGARCDFSNIQQGPEVRFELDIDAPRDAVFNALINPEELNRYIADEATVAPQVGGVYDYGWENGGPVKILELVPDEKLSFDWEYAQEPKTVVSWSLEGSGGKTHLTLVHSGFGPSRLNADYQAGWSRYLNHLKFMLESGSSWQPPEFLANDYA